jgi:glutamate 5-kinase
MSERRRLASATPVVVKIGSSSLAAEGAIARLVADVVALRAAGKSVVLVSSGAIAHGYKKLGYKTRPKEIAKLQAAAAAGQSHLMHAYESVFGREGIAVAQVLLTHADLADRTRQSNARAALGALLAAGAVAVLNENDSVAIEEIKFGDNDQLAALVVPLVRAELLVLLSDVDGLLDETGARVRIVPDARDAARLVDPKKKSDGAGGMASKVEAARRATLAGAHVVIANARAPNVLQKIAAGEDTGTLFVPSERRLNGRRYWIAFTLRPRGDLVLDGGAANAVRAKNKSVLTVGVLGVRGDFRAGDAVRLVGPEGTEIGRGVVRFDANDAARVAGQKVDDAVLVHRDELVVW